MTTDTTQTTVLPESDALRDRVGSARFVLFSFDGPVCRLFAGSGAKDTADRMVRHLDEHGLGALLTEEEQKDPEPRSLLRAVERRHSGSDLAVGLAEWLAREEADAVRSAWPTPYADPLIHTWRASGVPLAVTTDISPGAVRAYLEKRDLLGRFSPHVYGRTAGSGSTELLKPHPHCLQRALTAMGAAPSAALMIGGSTSDLEAARAAGVSFLGYAPKPDRAQALAEAGADVTVGTLEPVLRLVRERGAPRRETPRGA